MSDETDASRPTLAVCSVPSSWGTVQVSVRALSARRRAEFLLGRTLGLVAAQRWLATHEHTREATGVRWRTGTSGRPRLTVPRPDVNIAHSQGWVVAAAAYGRVGIDLERHDLVGSALARSMSGEPVADLIDPGMHWACKEAVLKYLGCGLTHGHQQVRIDCYDPATGGFGWSLGPKLIAFSRTNPAPIAAVAASTRAGQLAVVWR